MLSGKIIENNGMDSSVDQYSKIIKHYYLNMVVLDISNRGFYKSLIIL